MTRQINILKLFFLRFPEKTPIEIHTLLEAYNEAAEKALDKKEYWPMGYITSYCKRFNIDYWDFSHRRNVDGIIEARRFIIANLFYIYAPECFVVGYDPRRRLTKILMLLLDVRDNEEMDHIVEEAIFWYNTNKEDYRVKVHELAPILISDFETRISARKKGK